MTKPSQEIEKTEQLLANPWIIDIEKHKLVKNVESHLLITMKSMFECWRNGVNIQGANQ